jgi:hypothetical protein
MFFTLDEIELLFNYMKLKIRIERTLRATEDRRVGAEEIPILVHLRLLPRSLIADVAQVANMIDQLPEELSLLGKHIRESGVDGRVGKIVVVVVVVVVIIIIIIIPTRTVPVVRAGSPMQIHPSKNLR